MRILITGGLGNLGSWLTRDLVARGHEVTVLASSARCLPGVAGFAVIRADLGIPDQVEAALKGLSVDAVIHAGSVNDAFVDGFFWKAYRVNTEGTNTLLHFLDRSRLRHFIYFSTFHVYGVGTGSVSEETAPLPRHAYATSHLAAELIVQQYQRSHGIPYTILRLTNSYGCPVARETSKWHLLLNDLARMAVVKGEIRLTSDGLAQRDFIWMGDVVRVVAELLATERGGNEVLNLGFGRAMTLQAMAEEVCAAYEAHAARKLPVFVGARDASQPEIRPLQVSVERLWQRFDWRPSNQIRREATEIFRLCES